MAVMYYLWSRGRIRPSEVYKIMKNCKAEFTVLKAFYLMEMEEEQSKLDLQIKIASAGLLK